MAIHWLYPLKVADVVVVFIAVLPVNDVRVAQTARVWLSKLVQYNRSNIYADAIGVLAQDKSPIICLASLRFAYTLPVGTCLTLVSILWCFNGFPQIRIQVLDNTKSGHFSHEKTTPQGGNYSFEICDLDGSGSISCIDHNRSIPSNKRFENTTVRGTSLSFWRG